MKRLLVLLMSLVLVSLWVGCGDGMAITAREREQRHKRILEEDMKQISDDWDAIWLMDRPGRLTWSRTE